MKKQAILFLFSAAFLLNFLSCVNIEGPDDHGIVCEPSIPQTPGRESYFYCMRKQWGCEKIADNYSSYYDTEITSQITTCGTAYGTLGEFCCNWEDKPYYSTPIPNKEK